MKKDTDKKEAPIKKVKLVTSINAFKAKGGNIRLLTYVSKKFKGEKTFSEWVEIFDKHKLD